MTDSVKTWVMPEFNLVYIRHSGVYATGGANQAIRAATADSDYVQGMDFLVDVRSSDLSEVSYSRLWELAGDWKSTADTISPCRVIFLHSSSTGFGIGRQAAAIFEHPEVIRNPFVDQQEALNFLGLADDFEFPD